MVMDNNAGPDGFGYTVAEKAELFYTGDGFIASTNPVWLQWGFDVLIILFEWVGFRKNIKMLFDCDERPHPKGLAVTPCG